MGIFFLLDSKSHLELFQVWVDELDWVVRLLILLNTVPFQLSVSYQEALYCRDGLFSSRKNSMELYDNSGQEGPEEVSCTSTPSKQEQLWNLTRLLRDFSSWSWKPLKMETAQPLWITCFNPWLSTGLRTLLYFQMQNFCMSLLNCMKFPSGRFSSLCRSFWIAALAHQHPTSSAAESALPHLQVVDRGIKQGMSPDGPLQCLICYQPAGRLQPIGTIS